jgi:hypothetical protein
MPIRYEQHIQRVSRVERSNRGGQQIRGNEERYGCLTWTTGQRNATQRNATQRNATQRNATQRNYSIFLLIFLIFPRSCFLLLCLIRAVSLRPTFLKKSFFSIGQVFPFIGRKINPLFSVIVIFLLFMQKIQHRLFACCIALKVDLLKVGNWH